MLQANTQTQEEIAVDGDGFFHILQGGERWGGLIDIRPMPVSGWREMSELTPEQGWVIGEDAIGRSHFIISADDGYAGICDGWQPFPFAEVA